MPKAHNDGMLSYKDSKIMTKVWLNTKSLRLTYSLMSMGLSMFSGRRILSSCSLVSRLCSRTSS